MKALGFDFELEYRNVARIFRRDGVLLFGLHCLSSTRAAVFSWVGFEQCRLTAPKSPFVSC